MSWLVLVMFPKPTTITKGTQYADLFNTYLLGIYYIPRTFLRTEDIVVNKTDSSVHK